ncbi:GntR family transcriptional regulator [Pseudorhodoplanes sp.]|uniref:GntR family transcriptional regulator n=1 Tax=Pseudorhodoplanes sp. TaxID=1934341 RepID=UPI003918786C
MAPLVRAAPGLAVNTVADYIKNGIRTGKFAAGQRLIASDLASELGVSLGVVREALSLLDGAGLIELLPNRGAQIRSLSRDDVRQIFELREALEGQAAALAARNLSGLKPRQALTDAFKEADRAAAAADAPAYRSANAAFHHAILALADNPRLVEIASELTVPIYRLQLTMLLDDAELKAAAAGHQRIMDAILAGDAERARTEMQDHVRFSGAVMMRLVE